MEEKAFWVVWNPAGGNPRVRHSTQESALGEAERLARLYEGTTFIVLQAVGARLVDRMQRIEYQADVELPF